MNFRSKCREVLKDIKRNDPLLGAISGNIGEASVKLFHTMGMYFWPLKR